MTTLITGFEPFGRETVNSSQLLVQAISEQSSSGVTTAILPVSYRRAEVRMLALLDEHRPKLVIALGLARSAQCLTLEELAFNVDDAEQPDNDGERRAAQRIVDGAPETYPSSLPIGAMVTLARAFGVEVERSSDPGRYVCNHVFFVLQHHAATRLPGCRSGFVHVPFVERASELRSLATVVASWLPKVASMEPSASF